MNMKKLISFLILAGIMVMIVSFKGFSPSHVSSPTSDTIQLLRSARNDGSQFPSDTIQYPEEKHFKNVIQLTFGGDNAEAYWSYDSKYIVFQRTNPKEGIECDRIFIGKVPEKPGDKFEFKPVSSGKGRTTCAFFTRDGKHIIYASKI